MLLSPEVFPFGRESFCEREEHRQMSAPSVIERIDTTAWSVAGV